MTEPSMQSYQLDFAAALISTHACAPPRAVAAETADRFRIYRNNFYHGLGKQLGEAYPVVRRLVGEPFFDGAARAFLAANSPRSRSLALFGDGFPGFLERFPPAASLPYLADVAQLERARLEALHAGDAAPLAPAALAGLGDALTEARFVVHPATRLVESGHPIVDIWRANQADAEPGAKCIPVSAQRALVTRPQLSVEVRAITAAEAVFARALAAGDDAGTAYDQARRADNRFDVTVAFRTLLAAGAIQTRY